MTLKPLSVCPFSVTFFMLVFTGMESIPPYFQDALVPLVESIRQACGTTGIAAADSRKTVTSGGVHDIPPKEFVMS